MENNNDEGVPEATPKVEEPQSSGSNFTANNSPETPQPVVTTSPEGEKKKFNWKLVALIISVLALLGIGAYIVMNLSDAEDNTPTEVVKNEIPLLRVALVNGPLNVIYNDTDQDGALAVNNQMYEGLVAYENVNKIVPRLADSWSNPDANTWEFKLKQGVVFHNGNPMTAEDVKFTLENSETVNNGGRGDSIVSVEVVDASTVRVVTDGPDPLLLGKLTGLWIVDATTVAETYPAGTGPYVVKTESVPTETQIELTAFDSYHGGMVYTRALQFNQLDNPEAAEAFNNEEVDIASALFSNTQDMNLPNMKTVTISDLGVAFLGMNNIEGTPLANIGIRQAIEKTLDPVAIVVAQEVTGQSADQFVAKEIPGYNPEVSRVEQNIAEAKQLVIDAGYPDGATISLSYASASNTGMFESVKTQLAAIGITVVADFYGDDVGAFFDKVFAGDAELTFLNYAPDVLDASDVYSTLFSEDGILANGVSAEVSALLTEASSTIDEQERLTILKSIAVVLQNDASSTALYTRDAVTGLADNYAVMRHFPNGGSGFRYSEVYLP